MAAAYKYCTVDGCDFKTKHNGNLTMHMAAVHGTDEEKAEKSRAKMREYSAALPVVICNIDGCT